MKIPGITGDPLILKDVRRQAVFPLLTTIHQLIDERLTLAVALFHDDNCPAGEDMEEIEKCDCQTLDLHIRAVCKACALGLPHDDPAHTAESPFPKVPDAELN